MTPDNCTIRLGCSECDCTDKDFITAAELEQCPAEGWTEITEVQSYEQACREIEPAETPGASVLDWQTHLGICPDCGSEE